MEIYIHHEGEKHGPLELEEVRALLEQGDLSPETKAWVDGAQDWVPLSDVPGISRVARHQPQNAVGSSTVEPMASVKGDIKNLKANTTSTTVELRQFLVEMRGQTPKEMLGTIAKSSLVRSITISAASIFGILLVMSFIAYGFRDNGIQKIKEDGIPKGVSSSTPEDIPAATASTTVKSNAPPDILGLNQTKKGEPKETNPFDTKGDLLNDIK